MSNIRIIYTAENAVPGFIDLCVTPTALVSSDHSRGSDYLRPIDYLSPEDIKKIVGLVFDAVLVLDAKWRKLGSELPDLFKMIGADLSIFLEEIMTADLVLNRVIDKFKPTIFSIGLYTDTCNMVQYEGANFGYIDLLADGRWRGGKGVKVEIDATINSQKDVLHHSNIFNLPKWKKVIHKWLSILRGAWSLRIDPISIILIKLGIIDPKKPAILIASNKDSSFLLGCNKSIELNNYLDLVSNVTNSEITDFQRNLITLISKMLDDSSSGLRYLEPFKNILKNKLIRFIGKRRDLLGSYLKMHALGFNAPDKMIVASTLGCGVDAWCAARILEQGGEVASVQHGGGYGNGNFPMMIFSDYRYSYFFAYGDPSATPMNTLIKEYGGANRLMVGSPILHKVKKNCVSVNLGKSIKKIFYIMNLCPSFYSAKFPWEHILEQLKTLDLLQKYSDKYLIDVKKDHSNAIDESLFKGLNFINKSPREVLHEYDVIITESAVSTAVLEAAVSNSHLVLFTGSEWEDSSKESLEILSKRAESFNTWSEFHSGLRNILENPNQYLDVKKIESSEFADLYCNPVTPEQYVNTIKKVLRV